MRLFVTGMYCSGKTWVAKRIADREQVSYVSFDDIWDYQDPSDARAGLFLDQLPEDFVVDAIPYGESGYRRFREWLSEHDAAITAVVCPIDLWLPRAVKQTGEPEAVERRRFEDYHIESLPSVPAELSWYLSGTGEVGRSAALDSIDYRQMLLDRVRRKTNGYDSQYQDIQEIGFTGYSGSRRTWLNMPPREWGGMSVVDVGCFNGYHCFRAEEAGASVIGLDRSAAALHTAIAVNMLRGGGVQFVGWEAGKPIPRADLTLCLNALHHFPDSRAVLRQMRSPVVIIEVDTSFESMIRDEFDLVEITTSDRKSRAIFTCLRREQG